jgi:hypothetical protein
MKVLKIIGYHLVFLIYYIVCTGVLNLCYSPNNATIGGLAPIIVITTLASPFLMTKIIINNLYYGKIKGKHANIWAIVISVYTILFLIGVSTSPQGFSGLDALLGVFHGCFIVSLFIFASKNGAETNDEKVNLGEKIEQPEIAKQDGGNTIGEANKVEPSSQEKGNSIRAKGSHDSANAKTIADNIRGLKSNKNNLNGGLQGVATAIYDGALETAATVIENGGKLIDAVKAAVVHIKENSDEKDDDKIYVALIKDLSDAGVMDYVNELQDNDTPSNPSLSSEPKTKNVVPLEAKDLPGKPTINYPLIGSLFIRVTLITLYICCLFDMPYSFYQLVKFTSLLLFTGLLIIDYSRKKYLFLPFSVIGIIIFNPIYKVLLGRHNWQAIDKGLAILLFTWIALDLITMLKLKERKKIIAREILILLSAIGFSILCLGGTFIYNIYIDYRIGNLKDKASVMQKVSDSTNSNFDYKQRNHQWFFERMSNVFNNVGELKKYDTEQKLWVNIRSIRTFNNIDSLILKWNRVYLKHDIAARLINNGFDSPQKLYNFLIDKSMTAEDSLNHKKATAIQANIENADSKIAEIHNSKLDFSDEVRFAFLSFVLLLIILFGLRYVYYLVIWCMSTLKSK